MKTLPRFLYKTNKLLWRITKPTTIGVKLILDRENCVLLVKHTYQPDWYLPGGGVKRGETLEETARREAAEELGAILGDLTLFGIYTNICAQKTDHVIVFSCTNFTITGKKDWEIEGYDFFGFENLPDGVSPGTGRRMQEYVSGCNPPVVGLW